MDNKDYLDFGLNHKKAMDAVDSKIQHINTILKNVCARLGIKYAPRNRNK